MRDESGRGRRGMSARSVRACVVLAASAVVTRAAAEPVTARWTTATGGLWADGSRWSTAPDYPSNGSPAGTNYTALIDAAGDPYWVRLDRDIAVDRLVVDAPATVFVNGATLRASQGIHLKQGKVILDGVLADTVVSGDPGNEGVRVAWYDYHGGTLRNVTLGVPVFVDSYDLWATGLVLHDAQVDIHAGYMGSGPINGSGRILLRQSSVLEALGESLVLGADVVVSGGSGGGEVWGREVGVVNRGLIVNDVPGSILSFTGKITNEATMRAAAGGELLVDLRRATFTNSGVIELESGGRLGLMGESINESVVGNVVRKNGGGTVLIRGTLDLTGKTFPLDAFNGGWSVGNPGFIHSVQSKVTGGTIVSAGAITELPVLGGVTFDGVTVNSDVRIANQAGIAPRNGTTFNGRVTLEGSGSLSFAEGDTLGGAAEIVFDKVGDQNGGAVRGAKLTIGPGVTIRTGSGGGRIGEANDALTNRGHVTAADGSGISITATRLDNEGTLEAVNGGKLTLNGLVNNTGTIRATSGSSVDLHAWSLTNSGVFHIADSTITLHGPFKTSTRPQFTRSNATVIVRGNVDNVGSVLTLDAFDGPWVFGGKVTGGQLGAPGESGVLRVKGYAELMDVTSNIDVNVPQDATLTLKGSTINKGTFDVTGAVTLDGDAINEGNISATGARVTLLRNASSPGTLSLTDSSLEIGVIDPLAPLVTTGMTLDELSRIDRTRSRSVIGRGATLDNNGGMIQVVPGNPLQVAGGTIKNGSVNIADGAVFGTAGGEESVLDNVAVTGNPTFDNGFMRFRNGSTWTGDRITIDSSTKPTKRTPGMIFEGDIAWDEPMEITLARGDGFVGTTTGTLTLNSDVTIRKQTDEQQNFGFSTERGKVINRGRIFVHNVRAGLSTAFAQGSVTNEGLIEVRGGDGFFNFGQFVFTNYANRELSGGRWHVYDGAAIALTRFDPIEVNAAEILLSGPTSAFVGAPLHWLKRNEGSLSFLKGQVHNVDALENVGYVKVDRQSVMTARGKLDSAAGTLDTDGLVIVTGTQETRAALLDSIVQQILAARNSAEGAWKGKGITSSAAAADPLTGLAAFINDDGTGGPIISTKYSTVTPDANSVIIQHTYNGDANIDGKVNADDYFRIDSGFLARLADPTWRDGDFNYDRKINADDYFLIDSAFLGQGAPIGVTGAAAVVAVPEPSGVSVVLLAGLLAGRRRRKS